MIATLRHRGPDDTGVSVDGPAALAAARLSIIDVAGGHQPIAIDGGRVTVVQNGEIYNYVELATRARACGRAFATASDTEVIAALYAEHRRRGVRTDARHVRDRDLGRAARPPGAGARPGRQEAALLHAGRRSLPVRVGAEGDPRGAAARCPTSSVPRCSSF